MRRRFAQVDVFGSAPGLGNPVAVVLDGDGLTEAEMQRFALWTNLSETTFVLGARRGEADYALRIFTAGGELPFAGHPTLGSCHAVLESRGDLERIGAVQDCAAGLVRIRRMSPSHGGQLSFCGPPLVRFGPPDAGELTRVAAQLRLEHAEILDACFVDNGPGWIAVLLRDASAVRRVAPAAVVDMIGVAGLWPGGARPDGLATALEVRAFCPAASGYLEDPVTGSLHAALGEWLTSTGRLPEAYLATQGGAIGRDGRLSVRRDEDGVWVGGATSTIVSGLVEL